MTSLTIPGPAKTPYSPIPCGDRKTIRFDLDWSAGTEYIADFTSAIDLKTIDSIQSVYVDNYGNASDLEIQVEGTGQRLIVPGGGFAYLPLFTREYPVIKFISQTSPGQLSRVLLNNFPTPSVVWTV